MTTDPAPMSDLEAEPTPRPDGETRQCREYEVCDYYREVAHERGEAMYAAERERDAARAEVASLTERFHGLVDDITDLIPDDYDSDEAVESIILRWLKDVLADREDAHTEVASLTEDLAAVMAERDDFHEWADRLAYAIAPQEVIGEHSAMNDPWRNALSLVADLHADHAASRRVVEAARPLAEALQDADEDDWGEEPLIVLVREFVAAVDSLPVQHGEGTGNG